MPLMMSMNSVKSSEVMSIPQRAAERLQLLMRGRRERDGLIQCTLGAR